MAAPAPEPVLDVRRFGRTPVGFIATMASCSLVALLGLVIAVRGGPVPALTGLALALLPVPQVHAAVLYLDRLDPAPRALLAVMFGAGAGVAALTALAGRALHTGVITVPELGPQAGKVAGVTLTAAVGGAVVAESLKGVALLVLFGARRQEIDGTHDGVVYASMTALGFALIANVYAYAEAERNGFGALASAFARRGILGPLWDPLFCSMIGIGISYAAMRRGARGYWAIAAGWVAAVALDALWNDSVAARPGRLAVVYLILAAALAVVTGLVAADRRRIVGLIRQFLPGYAGTGAVTEPDVTMLASMRWRRVGRQWARLHRGHTGLRAMSEYQLAATALALAANRDSLGLIAPEAFAVRRENSLGLMRAAVEVLRAGRAPLRSPPWERNGRSIFIKGASP